MLFAGVDVVLGSDRAEQASERGERKTLGREWERKRKEGRGETVEKENDGIVDRAYSPDDLKKRREFLTTVL